MACPTIDELSSYADDLCTGEDLVKVRTHLETCGECQEIIDVFKGEAQFIRDTLKEPILPEDFTEKVLNELEPKVKKRYRVWRRSLGVVAGLVLTIGIGAVVNPGFASQIGGLFTSEKVDDGLRIAEESGLTKEVNLEVTDNGITFKVEDMIVDSTRIALSHQFLNAKGQAIDIYDFESEGILRTVDGEEIEVGIQGWNNYDNYGLFEFSLPTGASAGQIVADIHLTEINGVTGNWQLEVPIDMDGVQDQTKIVSLDAAEKTINGVTIQLREMQYAPATNALLYETRYSEPELKVINSTIKDYRGKYNLDIDWNFMFGTQLLYHVKNEKGEVVLRNGDIVEEELERLIQGHGSSLEEAGHVERKDSFEPVREKEQLTFVLDGVEKVVPADFSVEVNQAELKKQPITFTYEENTIKIKSIHKEVDYTFEKSFMPIKRQKYFTMQVDIEQAPGASELNHWAIIDGEGQAHEVYASGSTDELTLSIYGFDKLPDVFTLQLVTKTIVEKSDEKWEVPLYE